MSLRALGRAGEGFVVKALKKQGFRILHTNVVFRGGELDIVAMEGEILVFVEVKLMTRAMEALSRVDDRKRRALSRAALLYMQREKKLNCFARFDVAEVFFPQDKMELRYIRDAFPYEGPPY